MSISINFTVSDQREVFVENYSFFNYLTINHNFIVKEQSFLIYIGKISTNIKSLTIGKPNLSMFSLKY